MATTGLEHVALMYDDVDAVVDVVAAIADEDLAAGSAVLLCTPPGITAGVRRRLGPAATADDRFLTIDVDDRYARPIDALGMLWRTTGDFVRSGAERVHSIGEIAFSGGPGDAAWMWYEAACDHVLRDEPLTATCLYDTTRTPQAALTMAGCTHSVLRGETGCREWPRYANASGRYPAPVVALPARPPDVCVASASLPADVRAAVARHADHLSVDVRERTQLVVTELVANAVVHAGGATEVSIWFDQGRVALCVDDEGPGVTDPYATLRPPRWSDHGRGLWLSHHEASALSLEPRLGGGTRAAAVID